MAFKLKRTEPEPVEMVKNLENFFILRGTELDASGVSFHASTAEDGDALDGVKIGIVADSIKGESRLEMVAEARTVADDYVGSRLWLVGTVDAGTRSSIRVLHVIR